MSSLTYVLYVAFNIPANAMLSVELHRVAKMLKRVDPISDCGQDAEAKSQDIRQAVLNHGIFNDALTYETNGEPVP